MFVNLNLCRIHPKSKLLLLQCNLKRWWCDELLRTTWGHTSPDLPLVLNPSGAVLAAVPQPLPFGVARVLKMLTAVHVVSDSSRSCTADLGTSSCSQFLDP
ncbi:hypothetical protein TSUD_290470 [Trifolium subterraneum]|uniref:Uncharacterized protein n=1 Tax=Trifolium subterraneum TaxID=3900 RepID=A0A2Z6MTI0_TRISU|nr:hypothetical protein TSUD_290470 [Trifolium subterraneum]